VLHVPLRSAEGECRSWPGVSPRSTKEFCAKLFFRKHLVQQVFALDAAFESGSEENGLRQLLVCVSRSKQAQRQQLSRFPKSHGNRRKLRDVLRITGKAEGGSRNEKRKTSLLFSSKSRREVSCCTSEVKEILRNQKQIQITYPCLQCIWGGAPTSSKAIAICSLTQEERSG
jgi:hypothetical protein